MEKLLFVDDDKTVLQLYYEEFSEEGYEVILAENGQEALQKFEKESPQLIIMDIRMPGMSGMEALAAVLARERTAPVIFNTAVPRYREDFMTWGVEAFVLKSSDLGELKEKIRDVLQKNPHS
jgi:DNA-binding response OmpR family regulator